MTDPRAAERCPSRADLLCAIEGELSGEERVPLLSHLTRCADCRRAVDEIDGYVELVAAHIERSFDADRVRARFDDFLQRLHRQKQALIHASRGWRSVGRWLPLAAVIPVLVVAFVLTSRQEIVRADELVVRAVATERAQPAGAVRVVRINVTPALMHNAPAAFRLAASTNVREVPATSAVDVAWPTFTASGNDAALEQLLAATSRFSLRQPLSVHAFDAWRGSLTNKQDRVTANGELLLVLHTRTTDGLLREAFLTVRRDTFHVVGLTLVFEGIGRVEIDEIAPPAPRQEPPTIVASATPPSTSPIVAPRLAPSVATTAPAVAPTEPHSNIVRPDLRVWRARTLGSGPASTMFASDLRRLVSSVKAHVRTLQDLAKQESGTSPTEPSAEGGATTPLRQRIDESYAALCEDLSQLESQVVLLFGARDRALIVEQTPADWQRRATAALPLADALERHIGELLTNEDLPAKAIGPKGRHPVTLTFGALWDAISAPDTNQSSRR